LVGEGKIIQTPKCGPSTI